MIGPLVDDPPIGRDTFIQRIRTMKHYRFRLYVTGDSATSRRAIRNLRSLCESELRGRYEIEVVDVLEHPALAGTEKILATPTVVRELPEPIRKLIGDLSDRERVWLELELEQAEGARDPTPAQDRP